MNDLVYVSAIASKFSHERLWRAKRSPGFTLLELLVVIAIVAVSSGVMALAVRDSKSLTLRREADRVIAAIEAGRVQSRSIGVGMHWQTQGKGFWVGAVGATVDDKRITPWLDAATAVSGDVPLVLGPEPILPAQTIILRLGDEQLRIGSKGLQPFQILDPGP